MADPRTLSGLVPFVRVSDVDRSITFYGLLGFTVENTVEDGGHIGWAWLTNGEASLMLSASEEPVDGGKQGVLFYLYAADVEALHADLKGRGLAVGPISRPFYAPQGEFRLEDPDGYVLMLTHSGD